MKSCTMKSFSLLVGFLLCAALICLEGRAEAKQQEFDFSGRPLSDLFTRIATWGKYNIIADFDDTHLEKCILRTREGELEPDEWFCEEALCLLRNAFHFEMTMLRPFVLVYRKGMGGHIDPPTSITKRTQYIPGDQVETVLAPLLSGRVQTWFEPATRVTSFFGNRNLLEEVKKAIETIDTPIHSLRLEFEVRDLDTKTTVSSWTMVSESQSPFRVLLEPASTQAFSLDLQGRARVNDDGKVSFDFQMGFHQNQPRESVVISQRSCGQEKIWQESRVSFANRHLSMRWRGTVESISIRGWREDPPSVAFPQESFVPPKPGTITSFDSPSADTCVPAFVSIGVPVLPLLEKLAAIDQREILCDETVSGTISVFCQAPRTDPEDLIRLIARVKGWKAHKSGSRWAIAKPAVIDELIASDREPFVSKTLRKLEPRTAAARINQVLSRFGYVGAAKPHPTPGKVTVTGGDDALRLAETYLDAWAEPFRVLKVVLFLHSPVGKSSEKVSLTGFQPFQKSWGNDGNTLSVQLQQILANDDGYVWIQSLLDQNEPRRGRMRVHHTFRLPRDPRASLVQVQGFSTLNFKLLGEGSGLYQSGGEIAPLPVKPGQSTDSPSEDDLDSSF